MMQEYDGHVPYGVFHGEQALFKQYLFTILENTMPNNPAAPNADDDETMLMQSVPDSRGGFTRVPLSDAKVPEGDETVLMPLPSAPVSGSSPVGGFTRVPLSDAKVPEGDETVLMPLPPPPSAPVSSPSQDGGFVRIPISPQPTDPIGQEPKVDKTPARDEFVRVPLSGGDPADNRQLAATKGQEPAAPRQKNAASPAADPARNPQLQELLPVGWLVVIEGEAKGCTTQLREGDNYISLSPQGGIQNVPDAPDAARLLVSCTRHRFLFSQCSEDSGSDNRVAFALTGETNIRIGERTVIRFVPFCGESYQWD